MKTSKLICLGFALTSAIDSGKQIPLSQVEDALSNGSIIDLLDIEVPEYNQFVTLEKKEREVLIEMWQSLSNAYDPQHDLGVSNSGLCLLIAYCFKSIADNTQAPD